MKKGFTLAEMLMTVSIVAVVAAVTLPVLKNVLPNQEMAMFKKAYYITERSVAEMINDDDLYPEPEAGEKPYLGNTARVEYKGEEYGGTGNEKNKFCELFAARLNRASAVDCSVPATGAAGLSFKNGKNPTGTLTTTDGVVWILPISEFSSATAIQRIYVDVNGNKKPNCFYNPSTCKKPDRFTINLYQDGRVMVTGTMEREYLYRTNITKDAANELGH